MPQRRTGTAIRVVAVTGALTTIAGCSAGAQLDSLADAGASLDSGGPLIATAEPSAVAWWIGLVVLLVAAAGALSALYVLRTRPGARGDDGAHSLPQPDIGQQRTDAEPDATVPDATVPDATVPDAAVPEAPVTPAAAQDGQGHGDPAPPPQGVPVTGIAAPAAPAEPKPAPEPEPGDQPAPPAPSIGDRLPDADGPPNPWQPESDDPAATSDDAPEIIGR